MTVVATVAAAPRFDLVEGAAVTAAIMGRRATQRGGKKANSATPSRSQSCCTATRGDAAPVPGSSWRRSQSATTVAAPSSRATATPGRAHRRPEEEDAEAEEGRGDDHEHAPLGGVGGGSRGRGGSLALEEVKEPPAEDPDARAREGAEAQALAPSGIGEAPAVPHGFDDDPDQERKGRRQGLHGDGARGIERVRVRVGKGHREEMVIVVAGGGHSFVRRPFVWYVVHKKKGDTRRENIPRLHPILFFSL